MNESPHRLRAQHVTSLIGNGIVHHYKSKDTTIEEILEGFPAHDELIHSGLDEILINARKQARIQDALNNDRERLHSVVLSHDEHRAIGLHYEMLRREACQYNHMIRWFIENHAHGHNTENFTREEFTEWLTLASHGREYWAQSEITGAVSEIVLHAALSGIQEFNEVRYATLDEDLMGYDFVAEYKGDKITIDAKTGRFVPVVEQLHGHRHLEIYVPREVVHGFRAIHTGIEGLRQEVRLVLNQPIERHEDVGRDYHVHISNPVLGPSGQLDVA